jgi:hypothetical protein
MSCHTRWHTATALSVSSYDYKHCFKIKTLMTSKVIKLYVELHIKIFDISEFLLLQWRSEHWRHPSRWGNNAPRSWVVQLEGGGPIGDLTLPDDCNVLGVNYVTPKAEGLYWNNSFSFGSRHGSVLELAAEELLPFLVKNMWFAGESVFYSICVVRAVISLFFLDIYVSCVICMDPGSQLST